MKPIKDFENYAVSSDGTVMNLLTNKIKKPRSNGTGKGYMRVDLYKNGERRRCYVHRLVAEAYIPNPNSLPFVNHKDGNPRNNKVDNLEWCTPLENVRHAANQLHVLSAYSAHCEKTKKRVQGTYLASGIKTKVFESVTQASQELGVLRPNIVANLKGRQTHTKGIVWCYVEELK